MNPIHWRRANRLLTQFTKAQLCTTDGAGQFIEQLANELGVKLTPEERKSAATWLAEQRVNPQSKRDRMRLWGKAK